MAFVAYDSTLGVVDFTAVDTAGPAPINTAASTGSGRQNFYNQLLRGYDTALGGGEFIYVKSASTLAAGTWVEITPTLVGGVVISTATAWTGTANTGKPLGIVVVALITGQYGWVQVSGNAISTVQGAPAAGGAVYWQAAGVVSPTAVAGKQVVGAQFQTVVSSVVGTTTLTSTQAVVLLNRPNAQTQIT